MENNLPTKKLIIAIIENGDKILMRKKPAGSPPYKETWYMFGCERVPAQEDLVTLKNYLRAELDINVDISKKPIAPTSEIKQDHDGIEKKFIYTNLRCKYLNGVPKITKDIEQVEWVPKDRLNDH